MTNIRRASSGTLKIVNRKIVVGSEVGAEEKSVDAGHQVEATSPPPPEQLIKGLVELEPANDEEEETFKENVEVSKASLRLRLDRENRKEVRAELVSKEDSIKEEEEEFEAPIVWFNVMLFVILHSSLPAGIWQLATGRFHWATLTWSLFGIYVSGLGVTGGAHRLWSHRSYKASTGVELLLMALQTMAGQNSIYTWSRDHRVHHKFSETNADPHNIKRGFFFAHMGWLCCRKHPEVKEKGKLIDMSDLEANRVVMFQHRHFWWLAILFTVALPTMIPVWLWHERFWTSFTFSFMLRYLITLHGTWLVNSAAHYYGSRPYDARIEARESPFVIATGLGEGFHNYHHTFPYDYSTSEFGKFFNITTAFIDSCAALGLVYDRRKMDRAMIEARSLRTGDHQLANAKC